MPVHVILKSAFLSSLMMLSTIGTVSLPSPAAAVEVAAARHFVVTTGEQVIGLATSRISDTAKRQRVRQLLLQKGALADVARVAIGRAWKNMTAAQRQRYVNAVANMITKRTVEGFKQYNGQNLHILGVENRGRSGAFVSTRIESAQAGKQPIKVDWRIIDRNGPLQLFDIYVDGVSLLTTQRQTFTERLDRVGGNIEKFITNLEADSR